MATLRLYADKQGNESVIICDNEGEVDEMMENATLEYSVELEGNFMAWPTNRELRQL